MNRWQSPELARLGWGLFLNRSLHLPITAAATTAGAVRPTVILAAAAVVLLSGPAAGQAVGQDATAAAPTPVAAASDQAAGEQGTSDRAAGEQGTSDRAAVAAGDAEAGQADLDEAMALRLDAQTPQQLETLVALLESAIAKGLASESELFANKMLGSVQLERAQTVASQLMQGGGGRARLLRNEAVQILRGALRHDPELVEAHLLLARLQILPEGDQAEAIEACSRAIELLADDPHAQSGAYLLRAVAQSDNAARAADFDAAIKANPGNSEALQARALMRMQTGDVNGAVDDLTALLKRDPTNQAVAQIAVEQLVQLERTDDALALLSETLSANPSEGLYRLRGIIYRAEGKEDEALADFGRALAMQPKDPISLLQRAEISLGRGDVAAAKRDLEEAIRVEPRVAGSIAAVRVRCYIAVEEGRLPDAINDMSLIVEASPEESFWKLQLATLYVQDKRPRQAIALLDEMLTAEPENTMALRSRGDTLLGLGEHQAAINDYETALKVGLDTPQERSGLLNNLAWVLSTSPQDDLRDGPRAVKLATEAAELTDNQEAHVLSTLAAAYAEVGDFEQAVRWSEKSVELAKEIEHDQLDQLEAELEAFKAGKPWRESQETEENDAPLLRPEDLIDT